MRIKEQTIEQIKQTLPELPWHRLERFCKQGLSPADAQILVDDQPIAAYYEAAARFTKGKQLINWIVRDLLGTSRSIRLPLKSARLLQNCSPKLVNRIEEGGHKPTFSADRFCGNGQTGQEPEALISQLGLQQVNDTGAIEQAILDVIAASSQQVTAYKGGNVQTLGLL